MASRSWFLTLLAQLTRLIFLFGVVSNGTPLVLYWPQKSKAQQLKLNKSQKHNNLIINPYSRKINIWKFLSFSNYQLIPRKIAKNNTTLYLLLFRLNNSRILGLTYFIISFIPLFFPVTMYGSITLLFVGNVSQTFVLDLVLLIAQTICFTYTCCIYQNIKPVFII